MGDSLPSVEHARLAAADAGTEDWKKWGPYVSERQWGTCREDYGTDGNSWEYMRFQDAHRVAYRWGEDGIAGLCDIQQRLCLSLAMWNGKDPILKERLFGLGGPQGNHGEDVKEYYYYLDATPTHSYLKMLYKYPQGEFPYDDIRRVNGERLPSEGEYELMDTGIFDNDKYFDVFVEYARDSPDDICMRVTVHNRSSEEASIHLLPQLCVRNTWSWSEAEEKISFTRGKSRASIDHPSLGKFTVFAEGDLLLCENETNVKTLDGEDEGVTPFDFASDPPPKVTETTSDLETPAAETVAVEAEDEETDKNEAKKEEAPEEEAAQEFSPPERTTPKPASYHASGLRSAGPYKDAFHYAVIKGDRSAAEAPTGTKVGFHSKHVIPAGGSKSILLRLTSSSVVNPFTKMDELFEERIAEAEEFYTVVHANVSGAEHQRISRQALAGMIWTKQFYYYDIHRFLEGDAACSKVPEQHKKIRHTDWDHMHNCDIISMPDKWEFPWYATWDLAFHCLPLTLVDPAFAKGQLLLITREWYMHPNGQFPAFEWNFSDVNPPVHAWACLRVFQMERKSIGGPGDLSFLEEVFHKLMINFTWWVNRKDAEGRNIYQGGFLGLDNIGVFDRGGELPTGGIINQSDGTSWMAFYSLCLMRIAIELAMHNEVYESMASKFFEHFLTIARAMTLVNSGLGLWDEEDEFYYDVLSLPDGRRVPLKVRSMVGLIPLFAVEVLEPSVLEKLPRFADRVNWCLKNRPDLATLVSQFEVPGVGERRLLSLLRGSRMKLLLKRMLDPDEFLSDYGIRGLSKYHEKHPYVLEQDGKKYSIGYEPAESLVRIMGGNSNWRGPVWFPMNYLIIESLQKFHQYYGSDYLVECPTGSGKQCSILSVADMLSDRLVSLFEPSADGSGRPALRLHKKLATDVHFRDNILFYEHFHGDNGRGVGASHQTGWTGAVAKVIQARAAPRTGSQLDHD